MCKMKDYVVCENCSEYINIYNDVHYVSTKDEILCEDCGDSFLAIHDFTQYDDYPFIDEETGDWDGSQWIGSQWRKIIPGENND